MDTTTTSEPLGPDSFGGTDYPDPDYVSDAEALASLDGFVATATPREYDALLRIERAALAEQEKNAREIIALNARSVIDRFPCVSEVIVVCVFTEHDGDRGNVAGLHFYVTATIAHRVTLPVDTFGEIATYMEYVQNAVDQYGVAAVQPDTAFVVTRETAFVRPS